MITKNFARFMGMITSLSQTSYDVNMETYLKNISGKIEHFKMEKTYLYPSNICSYALEKTSLTRLDEIPSDSNTGMFFGSGGGTPSSDDYKLENIIEYSNSGLSVINSYCEHMPDENTLYVHTRVIKNKGTTPITISESGMISIIHFIGYQQRDSGNSTFLWARNVFEPIILQPEEIRTFSMSIKIE